MAGKSVTVTIYIPIKEVEAIERDAKASGLSRNQEILARIRAGRRQRQPTKTEPEVA